MNFAQKCPKCGSVFAGDLCPKCAQSPDHTLLAPQPQEPKSFRGFEVLEQLGRGGMGVVYKARQPSLDRFVALKVLPSDKANDPEFQGRFEREAKALASLTHPNILTVYEFGRENLQFFFAMEFVDGPDLRKVMTAKKLTPQEAVGIVSQVCDALEFAHGEGVVHRDIKPENILIDKRGRVKIADFGLAKLLRADGDAYRLTQSSAAMGTLKYAAPEQMENAAGVDHRCDLYSLGVMLYEMLTGGLPVGRFDPPSKLTAADIRLDQIVFRTLEKDPQRRYQSATDLKTDLARIGQAAAPIPKSRARWPIPLTAGLLAVAGIALIAVRPWRKVPPPALAPISSPLAGPKIDPERIQFARYEGPFNGPYADPTSSLPENPLIARDPTKMDLVANYLRSIGVAIVSPKDLRYGYVVGWYRNGLASLTVLDCANPEELEREFKKGRTEKMHWTYRDGSLLILAQGDEGGMADLRGRVNKKLGLP